MIRQFVYWIDEHMTEPMRDRLCGILAGLMLGGGLCFWNDYLEFAAAYLLAAAVIWIIGVYALILIVVEESIRKIIEVFHHVKEPLDTRRELGSDAVHHGTDSAGVEAGGTEGRVLGNPGAGEGGNRSV